MEDLTLALITLTSFVLLFVVAIFADRAGMTELADEGSTTPVPASMGIGEPIRVPAVDEHPVLGSGTTAGPRAADVA